MLLRLPGFRKLGVSKLITTARTMRISKGPRLRSRRPDDTADARLDGGSPGARPGTRSGCSPTASAMAWVPPILVLIHKNQVRRAGQFVFYVIKTDSALR